MKDAINQLNGFLPGRFIRELLNRKLRLLLSAGLSALARRKSVLETTDASF
jgi:hypothetical protein